MKGSGQIFCIERSHCLFVFAGKKGEGDKSQNRIFGSFSPWPSFLTGPMMSLAAQRKPLPPKSAPPTTKVAVKGTGFSASEVVDLFFNAMD